MSRPPMPDHWSNSSLSLYRDCPAALAAKLRGEPSCVPPNVRSGSALHEAIARYAQACWEAGKSRLPQVAQQIAAGYEPDTAKSLLSFAEDARMPWSNARGDGETCPVEQMWEGVLPNGQRFVGRIDLAVLEAGGAMDDPFADSTDLVKIMDWKQRRPSAWWEDAPPPQLLGYALLYWYANREQFAYRVMYGGPGWQGKWAFKAWEVRVSDLERFEKRLCGETERILADEAWEPNPGPDTCPRCFYQAACPLRGTETLHVLTDSPPDALAAAVAWHSGQEALSKKIIKALADENGGMVFAGGIPWGWTEKTTLQPADRVAFAEVCASAGQDPNDLRGGFDKTRVKKAIKEGWLPNDVLVEKVTGRAFGILKAPEDEPSGFFSHATDPTVDLNAQE